MRDDGCDLTLGFANIFVTEFSPVGGHVVSQLPDDYRILLSVFPHMFINLKFFIGLKPKHWLDYDYPDQNIG